jgi:hypothetical protein
MSLFLWRLHVDGVTFVGRVDELDEQLGLVVEDLGWCFCLLCQEVGTL